MTLNVFVDDREGDRIETAKKWWNAIPAHLDVGDYICNGKIVIEYKRMDDFLNSIRDGRLKRESLNQAELFDYHYVMIVGNLRTTIAQLRKNGVIFSEAEYNGAVTSLSTYTNLLWADNKSQAFKMMDMIFRKCSDGKDRSLQDIPKPSRNPVLNYLASCTNMNTVRAKNIVDSLGLTKGTDLFTLTKEDLLTVKGIGDKIADNVIEDIYGG